MTPISSLANPLLNRFLFDYLDLRQGARAPQRAQILPEKFSYILANLFLYECGSVSRDFTIRLAGEEIREMLRTTRKGATIAEVLPPQAHLLFLDHFRRICDDLCVLHNTGAIYSDFGRSLVGERLAMPLLDQHGEPRFVFGATLIYYSNDGRYVPKNIGEMTTTFMSL